MRRPLAWLALAAVALLMAGCLGGPSDPQSRPTPTPTGTSASTSTTTPPAPQPLSIDLLLDFNLAPCRGVRFQGAQPLADVQALLPDGFVAAPVPFVPGAGAGLVGVEVFACANLTTPNAQVPNTFYGQVYTFVERPADRLGSAPEADVHEYVFRVLAGEDILAVLWPTAGYDTYNGSASVVVDSPVSGLPVDTGSRVGQASVGNGYFLMGSSQPDATAAAPSPDGSFARYTVLADASVLVWTGTYDWTGEATGLGAAQLPDGDPFAAFETAAGTLQGPMRLAQAAQMLDMDLRRVFPG